MNVDASICVWRGWHRQVGSGCGTSDSTTVWPGVCADCGVRLTVHNAEAFRNERPLSRDSEHGVESAEGVGNDE